MNLMIRKYTPADKSQLIALIQQNIPRYFHASEEADFISYLDNEVEDYFVVEEKEEIIGCGGINYFPSEKSARISWDMVHPALQGKGIGRELVLYRVDYIRKKSLANFVVVRTSQLVYQFYQKLGFELENTEKDFWAKGFDLYLLKLDIRG